MSRTGRAAPGGWSRSIEAIVDEQSQGAALPPSVPSPLMCVSRRDDKKVMRRLANGLRLITRGLLWLTIALPVAWLTLWLSERLLHADVFGPHLVISGWFWFAWIVAALVVGNAVAYGCDRIFMQQRERSRPLRRAS